MNDMKGAATSKRTVVKNTPNPTGVVVYKDPGQMAHASVVKYFARHVSSVTPDNMEHNLSNGQILKATFADFDRGLVPEKLGVMMATLQRDETMELEDELYQAAFAAELLGPWEFAKQLASGEDYQKQLTHDLLRGGGYKVHL